MRRSSLFDYDPRTDWKWIALWSILYAYVQVQNTVADYEFEHQVSGVRTLAENGRLAPLCVLIFLVGFLGLALPFHARGRRAIELVRGSLARLVDLRHLSVLRALSLLAREIAVGAWCAWLLLCAIGLGILLPTAELLGGTVREMTLRLVVQVLALPALTGVLGVAVRLFSRISFQNETRAWFQSGATLAFSMAAIGVLRTLAVQPTGRLEGYWADRLKDDVIHLLIGWWFIHLLYWFVQAVTRKSAPRAGPVCGWAFVVLVNCYGIILCFLIGVERLWVASPNFLLVYSQADRNLLLSHVTLRELVYGVLAITVVYRSFVRLLSWRLRLSHKDD